MKRILVFDFYNTLFNPKNNSLFPGTFGLLNELAVSYTLVVITTGGIDRKREIKNLGIGKLFNRIVVVKNKNLQLFKKICGSTQKSIIIGDRLDEEIRFAKLLDTTYILVDPTRENPIKTIRKELL